MKNKNKFSLLFTIIAFLTLVLTGCSSNSSTTTQKTKSNQITVSYTLKEGKKTIDHKTVKVPKQAKVMMGLKKAWKVQATKGFITAIDGKKQNTKKKIYWTYTINGKWATKGANQQTVADKDKVKFTLDKVK